MHDATIEVRDDGGRVAVHLRGEFDHVTASEFAREVDRAAHGAAAVLIDMTEVRFADSMMLGAIVGVWRRHDVAFAVAPGGALWRLLELTGLLSVLPVHPSTADASTVLQAA